MVGTIRTVCVCVVFKETTFVIVIFPPCLLSRKHQDMTSINTVICILLGVTFHCVTGQHNNDKISVRELSISSSVYIRYASVVVQSLVENLDSADNEISFQVRIPHEAFITNFSITTNDRTIYAVIKDKYAALEDYNKAKEEGVGAGTVTQQTNVADDIDRDIFNVKVNIPAQSTVKFRLQYEELLLRNAGKYSQKIYIDAHHLIPELTVTYEVKEKLKFKKLTYQTPLDVKTVYLNDEEVTEDGYFTRKIEWKPSESEQSSAIYDFEKPFEIEYELDPSGNGGIVYVNDNGEFVHMFSTSCEETNIMMKQIVFVIDISGSMKNNPIKQVRQTMFKILSLLRSNDYFNIIIFNEDAIKWSQDFQKATYSNMENAKKFIEEKVVAKGSTNINDALLQAVDLFSGKPQGVKDERFGQIVFFLTDGDPTEGVTDENQIRRNIRKKNYYGGTECCRSSIYTIAFGKNAAIGFLRALANENEGFVKIIRETNEDGELLDLYHGVENPYLKDVIFSFKVDNNNVPEENVTQTQFRQYDCGNELVVAGSTFPGADLFTTVRAYSINDTINYEGMQVIRAKTLDADTISRLHAYKRVKQLLKQTELENDKLRLKFTEEKALNLSLQYGFVTPLTSFVVTELYPKKVSTGGGIRQNRAGGGNRQSWAAFDAGQYDSSYSFYDDMYSSNFFRKNITSSASTFAMTSVCTMYMYLTVFVYLICVSI